MSTMKLRFLGVALALSAPVGAVAQTAAPVTPAPLSLEAALAQALATNPRLDVARSGIAAAQARKRGAKAEGMPQAGVSVTGTAQGPARSIPGGGTLTPGRLLEAGADLSVPLYTGGRVKAGKKGAASAERAALARVDAEAQRLVLDVTSAFLDTLDAQTQIDLASDLTRLNQERLRIGRVRLAAGVGAPFEVTEAEADLAESIQREIDTQARVRQSGALLNTLLGQPAETPLQLTEASTSEPLPKNEAPVPDGLDAAQARELAKERPELRALREDVRTAEAGVDSARASRRPFVSLGGNLLRRIPETLLGGFAWTLGSSLVQSIFDGGRSRAQVEAARAEQARSGAVLASAERDAEAEVEQARVALEAAEKRLGAEEQRIKAATEARAVAQQRVQAGISAGVEAVEADTVLTRARTAAETARFQVYRSRVQLTYLIGRAYPQTLQTRQAQAN
jgi:outer membrane protein